MSDWTRTFSTEVATTNGPAEQAVQIVGPPLPAGADVALEPPVLADQINSLVEEAFEKVENISFAALGGVGLALLVWMVMAVLGKVESSFNRVWGVSVERSIWRKFTDYLSVLFVLPILIVAATSLPIVDFATRFVSENTAQAIRTSLGSGFFKVLTVFVMTSLTFAFVIMFMPNTRVRIRPALMGGLVAALLFIIWLRICAALQIGVGRYGKIYGSFAVVPIVLAWVFVSWEIVLFGAEVAFAVQNCATYRMEGGAGKANVQARIMLALSVVLEAGRAMLGEAEGFDVVVYAREKRVPVRFLNDIVNELVRAGYLAEISDSKSRFVLLKPPASLKVRDVMDTIMRSGVAPADLGLSTLNPRVERVVKQAHDGINGALAEMTIKDLLPAEA